ncbi:hypothetical protein AWW66_05275 [Micromonospora rosaria]|uniref:Uncharacterized protein n=1 Tax=Micromonospora rosaria TaxID=47874 RepID=A0A136PXB4_9ACTN|nr:hypothetical protein [Micromonospora rosaria]KXK63055.1 hypothetical protein AWW66_05275 [Micromonospora rosaria]
MAVVTIVVTMVAGLIVWFVRQAMETGTTPEGLPRSVPRRFDPGQQLFRLDFLPGSVRHAAYETEPDMHIMQLSGPRDGAPATKEDSPYSVDRDWRIEILMAARHVDVHRYDREYDEEAGWTVPGAEVAPVRGRPAFQNEGGVLSWEYAPKAWMRITVTGVDRHEETLRRVTEGIRWEKAPLALPFEAVGLPDDAELSGARLEWAKKGPMRSSAQYLLGWNERGRPDIVVGLSTESVASGRSNVTDDVTVSGRAATAIDWQSKDRPGLYRVGQLPGGCGTCVVEVGIESRRAHEAVGGRDDVLKLAASIRLVDGYEDRARWRPR